MAVGDAKVNIVRSAQSATVVAQPGAGEEWLIHTLVTQSGKSMEVHLWDGTGYVLYDTLTGGTVHNLIFRLTNSFYMKLINLDAANNGIGYMGVITK